MLSILGETMSDPIVDLTPTQVTLQEDQAAKEGFIKRDLIAVDECTGEVLFDAPPDETISTGSRNASGLCGIGRARPIPEKSRGESCGRRPGASQSGAGGNREIRHSVARIGALHLQCLLGRGWKHGI